MTEKIELESEEEMHESIARAEALHKLWWEFCEYMGKHGKDISCLHGYEDIQLMDDFCSVHPEVIRVHVDDSYHCNAHIYLIPHESDTEYMGTTAIFIPQCCGEINQFFFYPKDHRQMHHAMLELERKFQEKGDERWREIYGELNE